MPPAPMAFLRDVYKRQLEECTLVANEFQVDITDIRAALDDEESSRVDVSNDYTMILFDIPSIEYRHKREAYTTDRKSVV